MSESSPRFDADLVLLGGGCAGLSLAMRLATRCSGLKVIVIEPRTRYEEDRTWCGWKTAPHPYAGCVAASWPAWRVVGGNCVIARESSLYPYEMVPAGKFYEFSAATIRASASVCLATGTSASTLVEEHDGVTVLIEEGKTLRARWVVDTRPRVETLSFPSLWQNFVGYEMQGDTRWTERLGMTPVLMDFQPDGASATQFLYVLPLGRNRFLCEWTRFSTVRGEQEEIEADLQGWFEQTGLGSSGVLMRRESGSLPMAVAARPGKAVSRIVLAGTVGGSMRASTGYAFHSIQRWADRCAASLAAGGPPLGPKRNYLLDFLDEVFLTALQDRGNRSERLFCDLFARTKPDALVRFLSGIPTAADIVPVMLSLPWISFSKAAMATLFRRRRA